MASIHASYAARADERTDGWVRVHGPPQRTCRLEPCFPLFLIRFINPPQPSPLPNPRSISDSRMARAHFRQLIRSYLRFFVLRSVHLARLQQSPIDLPPFPRLPTTIRGGTLIYLRRQRTLKRTKIENRSAALGGVASLRRSSVATRRRPGSRWLRTRCIYFRPIQDQGLVYPVIDFNWSPARRAAVPTTTPWPDCTYIVAPVAGCSDANERQRETLSYPY